MLHNQLTDRIPIPCSALAVLIALCLCGVRPALASAPSAPPADERIKALERERDELKRRNGVLELRLKQLQATVNKQVTDALGPPLGSQSTEPPPVPHPPGEPASNASPLTPSPISYLQTAPWRSMGPLSARSAGIFSPLQSPVDLVSLAVAYQDALGEVRKAHRTKDSKENQPSAELDSAERKVQLLRSITKAMRDQLTEEVDRMHKLGSVHAVPMMDVRNLDTKLRIIDLILTQDPDAGPVSNDSATEKSTK